MGSKATRGVALGLALACAVAHPAHAQEAPSEPDVSPATPVDSPPPADLPESSAEPPAEPPAEPAVAQPIAPSEPASSPATSVGERALNGGIVGIGLGLAGAIGSSSDVYGPGFGISLVFGLSIRATSIEVRLGAGYATMPRQDALRGAMTRGSFDTRSIIVRQVVVDRSVAVSVCGGLATASIPLLSFVADDITGNQAIKTASVTGTGLAVGAAVHYPVRRHVELMGELTGYLMYWELPGNPYVRPDPDADNAATTISYTRSTDDVSATPWTLTVSLRALIN